MGKSKHSAAAGDDVLVRGSGKKFKKKGEGSGKTKKVLITVAFILAIVTVLGVVGSYSIFSSGIIQRKTVAAETDNFTVTSSMMTYFFNSAYQNFVNQSSAYLQYMGLDITKPLTEQEYSKDTTWHDQMLASAKSQVTEILLLCEAAKANGMELTDEDYAEIDAGIKTIEGYAASNKVTSDYYIKSIYGSSVTLDDVRECIKLVTLAEKYQTDLTGKYSYAEADWNDYFTKNEASFLMVDYLSYTFEIEDEDEDKEDGETTAEDEKSEESKDEASAAARQYAEELAAVTTSDEFTAYVKNHLKTVVYAGMDDEALKEDKIDIDALVEKCHKEGVSVSGTSDFMKWASDNSRAPYEVYKEADEKTGEYTVYMLLPSKYPGDLDYACKYRENYELKDYRYIFVDKSNYKDMAEAKSMADSIYKEFEDDKTEDNFALLASPDKYGDGKYEGGLVEAADYNTISDAVDEWVFNRDRKEGDSAVVESADKGYYILYFKGNSKIKWQANADNALKNEKYASDLETLEQQHKVVYKSKGLGMVRGVVLNKASS